MRRVGKSLLLRVLDVLGINALGRMIHRRKAIILFYHGICGEDFDLLKGYDERHTSRASFRQQLDHLKRRGYVFVSMTELVEALSNKARTEKYVVLTFDDGFRNVVEKAYPIMREFDAKGCYYLVSDLIGTDRLLWTDYVEAVIRNLKQKEFQFIFKGQAISYKLGDKRSSEDAMRDIKAKLRELPDKERLKHLEQFNRYTLNEIPDEFTMAGWEQIEQLDPDILEIGSHTRTHPNCDKLVSDQEIEREIFGSKIELEKRAGQKIEHFCYPAGSYDERIIACVKKYGYKSAVTVERGFNDGKSDLYRLKRIPTGNDFLLFKASISGTYDWIQRIKLVLKVGPSQ
jgi:peptidoglycan/xylan/chitin deacetylase (PgdA/CDA1 family)